MYLSRGPLGSISIVVFTLELNFAIELHRHSTAFRITNMDRTQPLSASFFASLLLFTLVTAQAAAEDRLIRSIDVSTVGVTAEDDTYWMHARPAVIPTTGNQPPRAIITLQKTDRVGTHMYHGLAAMWSNDLGKSWSQPAELKSVDRIKHENGLLEAPVDMTPQWHAKTQKLLATGATFWQDLATQKNIPRGPSETAYTVYDPASQTWSEWLRLKLPEGGKFFFGRAGCTQRVDLPNGEILLPVYFYSKGAEEINHVTVVRCKFDGTTLSYIEHGSELTVDRDAKRNRTGLYEPSLTQFNGKYLLTMRADVGAWVSVSDDGLHFTEPKAWTFDDGQPLGSYNTQQHWVTHSSGLYLSYTRKGANNDNVFRHRAPLFLARVDPVRLVVERATERIVLPNLGDAYGNFGVCNVTPSETWIVDCRAGVERGKESVYLGRIHWNEPNQLVAGTLRVP
jgi:hypothetical protein